MATFPRSRTHEEVVCGVPTTFVLTAYSNRVMVVVTQQPNMGTLVSSLAVVAWRSRRSHLRCESCCGFGGFGAMLTTPSLAPSLPVIAPLRPQIHAEADRPLDPSSGSLSTRVIFGRRDDETLEVIRQPSTTPIPF